MLKQVHVFVMGDVIGVGFRAWVKIQAKIFDLKGWVKNVYDDPHRFGPQGGIEAVIQGEESNVEKMLETLQKGSPIACVEDVEVIPQDAKEVFEEFEIRK